MTKPVESVRGFDAAAVSSRGAIAIAWCDTGQEPTASRCWARVANSSESTRTGPIHLFDGFCPSEDAVGWLGDRVAVVASCHRSPSSAEEVVLALASPEDKEASLRVLHQREDGSIGRPWLATTRRGAGAWVAWYEESPSRRGWIEAIPIDRHGRPAASARRLNDSPIVYRDAADVAALPDGSVAAAYVALDAGSHEPCALLSVLEPDPDASPRSVRIRCGGVASRPRLAVGRAGEVVVVWRQTVDGGPPEVLARVVGREGRPVGPPQRIDEEPGARIHGPLGPSIAFVGGEPVVVWHVWRDQEVRRFMRRLDGHGRPVGTSTCIDTVPSALVSARSEEVFGTEEDLLLLRWLRSDAASAEQELLERVRGTARR